MNKVRLKYFAALLVVPLAFGAALEWTHSPRCPGVPAAGLPRTSTALSQAPLDSGGVRPVQSQIDRHTNLPPAYGAQPNVLELPIASPDFVGDWGGYLHSTIDRISPALVGQSPDRVSVIFGRQGGVVFVADELYTAANQRVVRRPTARMLNPGLALVEYEIEDRELYYLCSHRFGLAGNGSMNYRATVAVYDRHSHQLMGIVTQRATLHRLLTRREQLLFARPSRGEIPRERIFARRNFAPR